MKSTAVIISRVQIKDYEIHYQVHGNGPIRLVLVMGLMCCVENWDQTLHFFAGLNGHKYSCLVFDNRGTFGSSTGGLASYTTLDMAKDALKVTEHVHWHRFHLVGISLGGMIALELAAMVPARISSLAVLGSCAKMQLSSKALSNLPFFLYENLFPTISFNTWMGRLLPLLFTRKWLDRSDARFPQYSTNRDRMIDQIVPQVHAHLHFSSLKAVYGQLFAIFTHHVSDQKLEVIGQRINRVLFVAGTDDELIPSSCSDELGRKVPGSHVVKIPGAGHGLVIEQDETINQLIHESITCQLNRCNKLF